VQWQRISEMALCMFSRTAISLPFERKRELFTARRVSAVGGMMRTTALVPVLASSSSRDGATRVLSNDKGDDRGIPYRSNEVRTPPRKAGASYNVSPDINS